MVATDQVITEMNAHISLNKKTEGGIWRKETMLIGEVVMRREALNHHPEVEVQHRREETLPHDLVNRQKEVELGLDKILRTIRIKSLIGIKRNLPRELEILEAPDMKCHIIWIQTEFLFGLLGAKSL